MINSTAVVNQLFKGFGTTVQFFPCTDWNGPHHIFLQIANFFLFLALFFGSTGIYSLLFLRMMMLAANLVTLLWTWLVSCSSDLLLWNGLFAILNTIHVIIILFKLHPLIRYEFKCQIYF